MTGKAGVMGMLAALSRQHHLGSTTASEAPSQGVMLPRHLSSCRDSGGGGGGGVCSVDDGVVFLYSTNISNTTVVITMLLVPAVYTTAVVTAASSLLQLPFCSYS